MGYNEVVDYLYGLKKFGKRSGHPRTRRLLHFLGDPHKELNTIHIGGTNGKSSTCTMIGSILGASGFKVGLFTSPHLHSFNERITVDNKPITKRDVLRLASIVQPCIDEMKRDGRDWGPSFTEVVFSMAMKYFMEKKVDFAIVEAGLGGGLDPSNVIDPMVSIITNVELDHAHILGGTYREIAREKAGIIKENGLMVTATSNKEALQVIEDTCHQKNSRLYVVGRDMRYKTLEMSTGGQRFDVNGIHDTYKKLETSFLGECQLANATLAISAIELLQEYGIVVPKRGIEEGLVKARLDGRMEIVQESPIVLMDTAHNPSGIEQLCKAIQELFVYKKLILLMGIAIKKPIEEMISKVVPITDHLIITRAKYRGTETGKIEEVARRYVEEIEVREDVKQGMQRALSLAKRGDLVCVTGSTYVVDEARRIFFKPRE